MIRTDNFIQNLTAKGLVEDAMILENGYDIQYKGNIVSVRFNNKGGALIYNQKKNNMLEIQSGRLDEVLHKYIVQSLFGLQNKTGTRGIECKNAFLVPTKVINNSVIFEDASGRKFTVNNATPKAILSYYKNAAEVNADDVLVLLNGFEPYLPNKDAFTCNESTEVEVQLLKCSVNFEDYAVCANSENINDVGQTIVGNFLYSSADKINLMTFEEDSSKMLSFNSFAKRNINSSTVRTKNPFAARAKEILSSKRNKVTDYLNDKYPYGLCVSAMEQVLAYDSQDIFNSVKMDNPIDYKNLYSNYLKDATEVQFRLDSNKSLYSAVIKENKSIAKFRAIPEISSMHDSLKRAGYYLSELESGLTFKLEDPAVAAIVSNCKNFVPVSEKVLNTPNTISKVIGSNCTDVLADYGIIDEKQVFNSLVRIVIN